MEVKPFLREISRKRNEVPSFDEYPFNIPAIRQLSVLELHPYVTFSVGENGTGKSTLAEGIAVAMGFGPEGGTKNVQVETADTVSELHNFLKTVKSFKKPKDYYFLRAESFYNIATYMDRTGYLSGYGGKSLHDRSHGEAFMATLTNKLRGKGFYIFDEPEAALSATRQMAALTAIHRLVEDESQFIVTTHSPILLAYPRSKIAYLDGSGITETSYEDTEHDSVTRQFLNNYKEMVDILMSDE
jgi:predicted ATPase